MLDNLPGIFPSPITCSDCIPFRLPRSAGNTEGTPGKVKVLYQLD
jgi:hypothetical protein